MLTREEIFQNYEPNPDNLLFILHDIQENNPYHYLSEEDLKKVAEYLGLTYSFVYGVVTFYTMYSTKPRGRYLVRICQSPPCHLMGSTDISEELKKHLKIDFDQTTPDGLFTLEKTSCLGVCGVAPAMMINDEVYGNLTPQKIVEIIEEKRRQ